MPRSAHHGRGNDRTREPRARSARGHVPAHFQIVDGRAQRLLGIDHGRHAWTNGGSGDQHMQRRPCCTWCRRTSVDGCRYLRWFEYSGSGLPERGNSLPQALRPEFRNHVARAFRKPHSTGGIRGGITLRAAGLGSRVGHLAQLCQPYSFTCRRRRSRVPLAAADPPFHFLGHTLECGVRAPAQGIPLPSFRFSFCGHFARGGAEAHSSLWGPSQGEGTGGGFDPCCLCQSLPTSRCIGRLQLAGLA